MTGKVVLSKEKLQTYVAAAPERRSMRASEQRAVT